MYLSKLIIVCLGLIAVACADDDDDGIGMTSEELVDALEPFGEQCEIKPERDHIKQLIKNEEKPHQTSKCFRHCLYKEFGLVEPNATTLNVDKTVEMMLVMFADGKEDMKEIVEKCNDVNKDITEKCENAHQHFMCILNDLKARGYKIPTVGK